MYWQVLVLARALKVKHLKLTQSEAFVYSMIENRPSLEMQLIEHHHFSTLWMPYLIQNTTAYERQGLQKVVTFIKLADRLVGRKTEEPSFKS